MICVYFVSYVPALLMLRIPGYERADAQAAVLPRARRAVERRAAVRLGQALGQAPIAPAHQPEQDLGRASSAASRRATALGTAHLVGDALLARAQAALMALVITLMGFAGGLIMSAIKRDRGVKDFGALIAGHGGVLDRIDSLCFAAPVFFHLTRYFYAT